MSLTPLILDSVIDVVDRVFCNYKKMSTRSSLSQKGFESENNGANNSLKRCVMIVLEQRCLLFFFGYFLIFSSILKL